MTTLFAVSIIISLFCVGLRIISSPGMLLYLIREKYDKCQIQMKGVNKMLAEKNLAIVSTRARINSAQKGMPLKFENEAEMRVLEGAQREAFILRSEKKLEKYKADFDELDKEGEKLEKYIFFRKPIYACVTCMASFWTVIAYLPVLIIVSEGNVTFYQVIFMPVAVLIVAALNSIIYALYEFLSARAECPTCK